MFLYLRDETCSSEWAPQNAKDVCYHQAEYCVGFLGNMWCTSALFVIRSSCAVPKVCLLDRLLIYVCTGMQAPLPLKLPNPDVLHLKPVPPQSFQHLTVYLLLQSLLVALVEEPLDSCRHLVKRVEKRPLQTLDSRDAQYPKPLTPGSGGCAATSSTP